MEVVIPPSPAMDFNFESGCSTPYISAPSSPKSFGNLFFSAPTSPARVSAMYRDFNDFSSSAIPFDWEEKPGTPKSKPSSKSNNNNNNNNNNDDDDDEEDDFAFNFSGQQERPSLSAEDLFDGGVIKPLKPPPRLQLGDDFQSNLSSPRSPRSPIAQGKKMIREAFSPRQKKKKEIDPFAAAIEEARKGLDRNRGRERVPISSSYLARRGARSVSPLRVSEFAWEEQQQQQQESMKSTAPSPSISKQSSSSSTSSLKGSRKWRLKDFLLFRSASEGRASEKDPLRKYTALPKQRQQSLQEDVKNSSFRSTDSSGSVSGSTSRRRGPESAHGLHYKTNRAVAEEMKRKTFLPYKQGLLGCLGFNPTFHGLTSRTFG